MRADKEKQIRKLKTARGQLNGLIKMMEDDRYCIDISTQLMATISILKNVNRDVLSAHLQGCILEAMMADDEADIEEKVTELRSVIDKLSK